MAWSKKLYNIGFASAAAGLAGMIGITGVAALASYGVGGSVVPGLATAVAGLGTTAIGGVAVFAAIPVVAAVDVGGVALTMIANQVKKAKERAELKEQWLNGGDFFLAQHLKISDNDLFERRDRVIAKPRLNCKPLFQRSFINEVGDESCQSVQDSEPGRAGAFVPTKNRTAQEAAGMLQIERDAAQMKRANNETPKAASGLAMPKEA